MGKNEKWSEGVHETSRAELLPKGLFTRSAEDIAETLKKVVLEDPTPKERSPLDSSMDMLNFYINRAGSNLSDADRTRLDTAKQRLRELFAEA